MQTISRISILLYSLALDVWLKEPLLLMHFQTLFIIGYIIADESLDKRRQYLLELTISGKHGNHYLWLFIQSYSVIQNNLKKQAKVVFVWYPKQRSHIKMVHDEHDVLTDD